MSTTRKPASALSAMLTPFESGQQAAAYDRLEWRSNQRPGSEGTAADAGARAGSLDDELVGEVVAVGKSLQMGDDDHLVHVRRELPEFLHHQLLTVKVEA